MTVLRAVGMAFALYSRIPVPPLDWESGARRYTLYAFPLVGLAVGGGLLLWTWLAGALGLGQLLWAAGMTAIPLLITGGIHLDGFCDVCDALASHQSRERKLEIMADPHVGAFAVIGCSFYLILSAGAWSEIDAKGIVVMAMAFVLERAFSGLAAVNFKGARKDGMLTAFREPARKRTVTVVLAAEAVISAIVMCYLWLPVGLLCSLGAVLTFVYYYKMAMKEFGGTTGDLAGWFLQTCELVMLMLTVVGKMILA